MKLSNRKIQVLFLALTALTAGSSALAEEPRLTAEERWNLPRPPPEDPREVARRDSMKRQKQFEARLKEWYASESFADHTSEGRLELTGGSGSAGARLGARASAMHLLHRGEQGAGTFNSRALTDQYLLLARVDAAIEAGGSASDPEVQRLRAEARVTGYGLNPSGNRMRDQGWALAGLGNLALKVDRNRRTDASVAGVVLEPFNLDISYPVSVLRLCGHARYGLLLGKGRIGESQAKTGLSHDTRVCAGDRDGRVELGAGMRGDILFANKSESDSAVGQNEVYLDLSVRPTRTTRVSGTISKEIAFDGESRRENKLATVGAGLAF